MIASQNNDEWPWLVDLSPSGFLSGVNMLELMLRAKIWCDVHINDYDVAWQGNLIWFFRHLEDATLFELTWC